MLIRAVPVNCISSYLNRLAILLGALMTFDFVIWGQVIDPVNLFIFTVINDFFWWRQYDRL